MVSSTGKSLVFPHDYNAREATAEPPACHPKMNEFLTNYSSDHTLLWALLIIGVMAVSAVGLHLFWNAVFRLVATLRGGLTKTPEDGG